MDEGRAAAVDDDDDVRRALPLGMNAAADAVELVGAPEDEDACIDRLSFISVTAVAEVIVGKEDLEEVAYANG